MDMSWMAWTLPTALFFLGIAGGLMVMGLLHRQRPAPAPKVGALGLPLQRGDRFFLVLLGSAFIHLAWVGLTPEGWPLWFASLISIGYAGLVFRFA